MADFEIVETALKIADGIVEIVRHDSRKTESVLFSERFSCPQCGLSLPELEPLEELGPAHDAYVEAWRGELDLIRKVRDPGFGSVPAYLGALEASAFEPARATVRSVCEDLERIATAAGREVDLACDGRPG